MIYTTFDALLRLVDEDHFEIVTHALKIAKWRERVNLYLYYIYFWVNGSCRSIQPLCLGGLVTYFSQSTVIVSTNPLVEVPEFSEQYAYWCAGGILSCAFISILINHPFILYSIQMGMRVRLTCSAMIYKKVSFRSVYLSLHHPHIYLWSKKCNDTCEDFPPPFPGFGY